MPRSPRELRILDGDFVRSRRVLLGLSQRALAGALGVTPRVIWRIEHGMRQNELDVSFIVDLADALAVTPGQLLVSHQPVPRGVPGDRVDPADVSAVGGLLIGAGDWVLVDGIAEALGWTLGRTLLALDELGQRATAIGQRLAWLSDREVCLCGDVDDELELGEVTARGVDTWGLTDEEAYLLFVAANGGDKIRQRRSLVAVRRLIRAGMLTAAPIPDGKQDDDPRVTDRGRFNLCLDELGLGYERTVARTGARRPRRRPPRR